MVQGFLGQGTCFGQFDSCDTEQSGNVVEFTVVKNPSKPAPPSMTARPPPSVLQESMKQHQQMTQNGVEVFLCPICNSKYHNLANYRQHMKFHANESLKEERNAMMNAMVSSCYGMLSEILRRLTFMI